MSALAASLLLMLFCWRAFVLSASLIKSTTLLLKVAIALLVKHGQSISASRRAVLTGFLM